MICNIKISFMLRYVFYSKQLSIKSGLGLFTMHCKVKIKLVYNQNPIILTQNHQSSYSSFIHTKSKS